MQKLAAWVQAISTAILAVLTIWVVFFSEAGDLAVQLLQSELLETKQTIHIIYREKEELKNQKERLQDERNELARQREKHVVHVVSGRLRDIWAFGTSTLASYKSVAEAGQELLDTAEKVEPYRNGHKGKEIEDIGYWVRTFQKIIHKDIRSEWQDMPMADLLDVWICSKDRGHVYDVSIRENHDGVMHDPQELKSDAKLLKKRIAKRLQDREVEVQRRLAEYHVSCFNELESTLRQRIELVDDKTALNIRDFSEKLLHWSGSHNASQEVAEQIRSRLTSEISTNRKLAERTIQLQVSKGASLKEIAEEARQVENNIKIARDWLDKATNDRNLWDMQTNNSAPEPDRM